MAQNTKQPKTGSRFYYKIIEGDFRRKALATDEKTVKRTKKDGTEVEEYIAKDLSGVLKSFELVQGEWQGKKMTDLVITVEDIGETYVIQIPADSKYFSSFVNKLPNLNFGERVVMSPYHFTPKDKVKPLSGITIYQDKVKVKDFYSKDNPLPGVPEFPANGDDSERKMWGLQQTIALKKVLAEQQGRLAEKTNEPEPVSNPAEEDSDLPF